MAKELASRWVRYSLAFIGLAALLAFLLPTGYTVGLLDAVATIVYILGYIVTLLFTLLSLPFAWLTRGLYRSISNVWRSLKR